MSFQCKLILYMPIHQTRKVLILFQFLKPIILEKEIILCFDLLETEKYTRLINLKQLKIAKILKKIKIIK